MYVNFSYQILCSCSFVKISMFIICLCYKWRKL